MKLGRKPALVQWKLPLGQAEVPASRSVLLKESAYFILSYHNMYIQKLLSFATLWKKKIVQESMKDIRTWLVRTVLTVTVVVVHSVKGNRAGAIQARKRLVLFIELTL